VSAADHARLALVLRSAVLDARPTGEGGLVVDASPEAVGRAALQGGVALTHLGPAEGAGLESLYFELTTEEAA
jgi:ABC-2 type transport system ATP-binding protein